jgi:ornithine cyclodeaminase/alanine dehydrogenase-like protein (mu-crystallin family)
MSTTLELRVEAVDSAEEAIRDADVVVDIPETEATIPLGAVIAQEVNPRLHPDDRVVYRLEGGTVQDLIVATWGYQWARGRGLGQPFDLSKG